MVALLSVIAIETSVLHLLLVRNHPVWAWSLTLASALTAVWLVRDFVRFGRGVVTIDGDVLRLEIGLRFSASIPQSRIATAIAPTWRDLPASGHDYLNGMKPATPNVLLTFREPESLRLLGVANRRVRQLGLHLDEPSAFLAAAAVKDPGNLAAAVSSNK